MGERVVFREVALLPRHEPTRATRHYVAGQLAPTPVALRIVRNPDDPGVFLLYLDADGCPQTDTWHETLEDALAQAQFEFNVTPREWRIVPADD